MILFTKRNLFGASLNRHLDFFPGQVSHLEKSEMAQNAKSFGKSSKLCLSWQEKYLKFPSESLPVVAASPSSRPSVEIIVSLLTAI
jgi:hypothetical protein